MVPKESAFVSPALAAAGLLSFLVGVNSDSGPAEKPLTSSRPPPESRQAPRPALPKKVGGIAILPGSDLEQMLSDLAEDPRPTEPRDHGR